jgi:putative copper export protein
LGGGGALLDPATLSWTWPALGPSSTLIALGAIALVIGWLLRSRIAAGVGAAALASSFGLTGHSQALDSPGLAPWAVALHVLIAAFWLAGPITLWPTHNLEGAALTARVTRFSNVAVAAIPLLFVLGLWLALLLAGGWTPLLTSLYGQLLLAKLAAASFALALGAYNKSVVTAQLRTALDAGRRTLKLTLRLDAVLFFIALGAIAAATSLTGPPSP